MGYESLKHIYYANEGKHSAAYKQRFHDAGTLHFHINIKQYNRKKSFSAFMCCNCEIDKLLEDIFIEHSRLLSLLPNIPRVVLNQFYMLCIVDEVKASNNIEGIRSTRNELQKAMENMESNSRFASTLNKYNLILRSESIDFGTCQDLRLFYEDFAYKEVVQDNPKNKLDGIVFRKGSVDVISKTGKIIHRGAFPEEKIMEYMDEALRIMNDDSLPVLLRSGLFHYLFAYIHPFYDGNGRTARFISSYTISKVLHKAVALRLSATIKRNTGLYYDLFSETDSEWNCGDLTPFVIGFLKIVKQAVSDTCDLLNRKLAQFNRNIDLLKKITNDKTSFEIYAVLLQASLLYGQGITPEDIAKIIEKSKNTVLNRLRDVIPKEHLYVNTIKRKNYYKLNLLILRK